MRRLWVLGTFVLAVLLGPVVSGAHAQTCADLCMQPSNCGKTVTCETGGNGGWQTITCSPCATATATATRTPSPTRTSTATSRSQVTATPTPTQPPATPTVGYPSCGGLCTEQNCERSFRCETGTGGLQDIVCGACPVTPAPPGPPVARLQGPLCGVVNKVQYLASLCSKASEGHTIQSYAWTFGDGGVGSGVSPEHTWVAAGTYQMSLVVTDDLGLQSDPAYSNMKIWNKPHGALFTDVMPKMKYTPPANPESPAGMLLPSASAGTVAECRGWVPDLKVVIKDQAGTVIFNSAVVEGHGNYVGFASSVAVPLPAAGQIWKMTTTYYVRDIVGRTPVKAIDSTCTYNASTGNVPCTHVTRVL
jgi:hypothetical protein